MPRRVRNSPSKWGWANRGGAADFPNRRRRFEHTYSRRMARLWRRSDTRDLKEAKALLEKLASRSPFLIVQYS